MPFSLWEKKGSVERKEQNGCAVNNLWNCDFSYSCPLLIKIHMVVLRSLFAMYLKFFKMCYIYIH